MSDPSETAPALPPDRRPPRGRCVPAPAGPFAPFGADEVEGSVPARFARQAREHARRVAVRGERCTLTYAALNGLANNIGTAVLNLRGEGAEPVALLLGKDAPMVAALLGVLKAGKIFVPLEPAQPPGRSAKILGQAGAGLIVTDGRNLAAAAELAAGARPVLNIDDIPGEQSERDLDLPVTPDTPAYIIYTSGSTGEPKGVVQNHRNVLHNIGNHTNGLQITALDRLTLLAACNTAQAMTDIFSAALNGATLFPFDVRAGGLTRLADWLRRERITIYHSSASLFRYLLGCTDAPGAYPDVRIVKLGSERLFRSDVELWRRRFPETCLLVNALSSTEAGTVCQAVLGKGDPIDSAVAPVGFPVADMEVLLLDDAGRPVGCGSPGEIVVRSRYLSPGYWRRPDLTREAFSAVPGAGGVRVYRTGDVGRIGPVGGLRYLGRKDFRAKIRGHGVEVAEVEAALLELGRLEQAVVTLQEDGGGETKLVAYAVPRRGEASPAAHELRRLLAAKLPDHMIPAAFVLLQQLPLTPGGKVDRLALPRPDAPAAGRGGAYVGARDALEHELCRIWEDVLGVKPVGVRDEFGGLGGHSLQAADMLARVERTFGERIPPAALFPEATVERLAQALSGQARGASPSIVSALQARGSLPPFFFWHGDLGGGLYCLRLARALGAQQPFYAVHPFGLDGRPVPPTIEQMAACCLPALRGIQREGPYYLGGYCNGGLVAFEVARRLRRRGQAVALLALVDVWTPDTVRHRLLQQLVRAGGRFLGAGPGRQRDWFLRLRGVVRRLNASLRRRRVPGGPAASDRGPGPGGRRESGAGHGHEISRRDKLAEYRKVMQAYVPLPYSGPITVFRPEHRSSQSQSDPAMGWRAVSDEVAVQPLPGDHITCITDHLGVLAEKLSVCLREARGRKSTGHTRVTSSVGR